MGTCAAVVGLVAAEVAGHRSWKIACKLAAAAGFLLTGALAGLPFGTPPQQVVFVGLVFGAVGDACLLSREKMAFLAGLVSFLLNHVAYVVAFGMWGSAPGSIALAAVPLLGVAALVGRWLGPRVGSLRWPVAAYIAVISAMVAFAVGSWALGGPGRSALLLGALLFYASDLAVARDRFVAPGPANKVWGLPTYFAAQLLFALSAPAV